MKLKGLREKRGLTQVELAKLLSDEDLQIDRTTVASWETGRRRPRDYRVFFRVAKVFDISVARVIKIFLPEKVS